MHLILQVLLVPWDQKEVQLKTPTEFYDQALIDGHSLYEAVRLYLDQKIVYTDSAVTTARRASEYRKASQPSYLAKLSRVES